MLKDKTQPVESSVISRDGWINKFWSIKITGIDIAAPVIGSNKIDAGWRIVRVGSIWRRDEEYHIYGIEDAVTGAVENLKDGRNKGMFVVTPIWVFVRVGGGLGLCRQPEIVKLAEKNFMRLINSLVSKRGKHE